MKKELIKKGQVTIFVILALLIVIVLLFLFRGKITNIVSEKPPIVQIQDCVAESVEEAVGILALQGGEIEPEFYFSYQGNKLSYLCYTEEYLQTCVMQKPLLVSSIEKEIENYAKPRVKECMKLVKRNLEKDGYEVRLDNVDVGVEMVLGGIKTDVKSDLAISKGTTQTYKSIKTSVNSNLYEMLMIATSILNWEAVYGDANSMSYMIYYPSIKVEKKKQGDGTTVYILTDRKTEEKFMFAVRSFVNPPGISGN